MKILPEGLDLTSDHLTSAWPLLVTATPQMPRGDGALRLCTAQTYGQTAMLVAQRFNVLPRTFLRAMEDSSWPSHLLLSLTRSKHCLLPHTHAGHTPE